MDLRLGGTLTAASRARLRPSIYVATHHHRRDMETGHAWANMAKAGMGLHYQPVAGDVPPWLLAGRLGVANYAGALSGTGLEADLSVSWRPASATEFGLSLASQIILDKATDRATDTRIFRQNLFALTAERQLNSLWRASAALRYDDVNAMNTSYETSAFSLSTEFQRRLGSNWQAAVTAGWAEQTGSARKSRADGLFMEMRLNWQSTKGDG